MKVVIHGFGSYPLLFKEIIKLYSKHGTHSIEWIILIFDNYYINYFSEFENVKVFQIDKYDFTETDELIPYQYFEHLDSEKRNFKKNKGRELENAYKNFYTQVDSIYREFKPEITFISQVEGFDGRCLIEISKLHGSEIFVPTSVRIENRTFFSIDEYETIFKKQVSNFTLGKNQIYFDNKIIPYPKFSLLKRTIRFFKRTINNGLEIARIRQAVLNNLVFFRDLIWSMRSKINDKFYDISTLDEINEYVFYALQYTPESSINTPAPYYVDQKRAIDFIRYNLPPTSLLIIKEHPAALGVRPFNFTKDLSQLSGTRVIKASYPSEEIIENARITLSITGTVLIEAALKGKNVYPFGKSLINNFLDLARKETYGLIDYYNFSGVDIKQELLNCSYPFVFFSPEQEPQQLFSEENLTQIIKSFDLEIEIRKITT